MRAIAIACWLGACGHPTAPPKSATVAAPLDAAAVETVAKVGLALHVTPADAQVLINGVARGEAGKLPPVVELKPGLYTLEIQRAGYTSYRVEFSVADKVETFSVDLEPAKR